MALLTIILPVFSLILLGKLILRMRLIDVAGLKGLTDLVFWIVLPALLFLSIAQHPAADALGLAAVYFAVALPAYGIALLLGRWVLGARLSQGAVFALNATYGNMGLLGIPIVDAAWGERGVSVLLSIIGFHSVTLLPLATALIEADSNKGAGLRKVARQTARGLVRNPVILAILFAYAWRATTLPIPPVVLRLLGLLAQAAPPLALICLGASLPRLAGKSVWREALLGAAFKLVLLPLAVAGAVTWAGLGSPAAAVLVVGAALPTGANAFMLARRAGALLEASASTVVIGTTLSMITLSVVIALLR